MKEWLYSRRKFICLILFSALIIFYILALYKYNPETHVFYPQCMLFKLTGIRCPSCGSQRAFYAILHGDIQGAFAYNQFLWVTMPYIIAVIYASCFRSWLACKVKSMVLHPFSVNAYIVLLVIWLVYRNLHLL